MGQPRERPEGPDLHARRSLPEASNAPEWPTFEIDGENARATLVIDRHDVVTHDLDGDLRRAWGDDVLAFS